MSNSELPIEIYLNIFQRLNRLSLKECLSVNKKWNHYAAQVYYQDIVLAHCQVGQLSRLLTQHPNNNISRWARKIKLVRNYKKPRFAATKKNFQQLLSHLPYLKVICLTDPEKDLWYLQSLLYINLNFVCNLQQINVNLNNIMSYNADILQVYYSSMARFRNSITHLQLINLQPSIFRRCGSSDILSYLSQFTRLTHVKFFKNALSDSSLPTLPAILKACSKSLQSFYLQDKLGTDDLSTLISEKNHHFPARLSHFQIHLSHFFLYYIKYIICHIPPSQLNTLSIEITDDFLTDWVLNNPSTMTDQFVSYLSLIKNLTFNTGKDPLSRGTTLTREAIPNCMGTIYDITSKIINKRPLFFEMKMVLNGAHRKPNTCIYVEHNRYLQLKITFQDPDWYSAEENIDIMDYIANDMGKYQSSYMINAFQMVKWHLVPISSSDISHLFTHMTKKYPFLHHFFVTNTSDSFAAGPVYQSQAHRDILNSEYIFDLTKRAKAFDASLTTPTKQNIKYASFENIRITDELLKTLRDQELEFEIMKFSGCIFEKDENNNVTLNIGNYVSTLMINMDVRYYNYIFLEAEIDGACVFYQSQKKTKNAFELLPSGTYAYNRYSSKNTIVFRIVAAQLNEIIVNAEYHRKTYVLSKLYPKEDVIKT